MTLCLNMIVKNEGHIIADTLQKLTGKIKFDYWVISDTGSTDSTKKIIFKFFNERGIKGELFDDEWVDFGHNRTLALQRAFGKSDYLLVFDADDEISGELVLPENLSAHDSYTLKFGNSTTAYNRTLLVNNRKKWKYTGVLHEYIEAAEAGAGPSSASIEGTYHIVSGRTSSRNIDPGKYAKDAAVLEAAFYKAKAQEPPDPIFNRYAYYCANSYRDAGNLEKAVEWYTRTVEECPGGWTEERYNACLYIYELMDDKKRGVYYLVKSHEYNPRRVEGIYELVKHYCCLGQHAVAGMYYSLVKQRYENAQDTDLSAYLFAKKDVYDFYLPYYMIIAAVYNRDFETGLKMYDIIFEKKFAPCPDWFLKHLVGNSKFYLPHCQNQAEFLSKLDTYTHLKKQIQK